MDTKYPTIPFQEYPTGLDVSIWRDQLNEKGLSGFGVIFGRSHLQRICPSRISDLFVALVIADIISS